MDPQNQNPTKAVFPQAYLDQMTQDARAWNPSRLPQVSWRFDGNGNFDSAESAFVARQLESMRPGVYKVEYPTLKGATLVSSNSEDDPGCEFVTITIVNQVGQVLVSRDMSTATPMVEVFTSQQSTPVYSMRIGYQYSLQEARNAIMAKRPLIADKAMACREQMERKLDDIIFVGETTMGLKGLLNQSGALIYTPINGLKGTTLFADKTPDEVMKDLNGAPSQIVSASLEVEVPDTAVFTTATLEYLGSTRVGDGTSQQILGYWKSTTPHIKRVESSYKGNTLGASGTSNPVVSGVTRSVFYKNDPVKIEYSIPQPFEQLPPQAKDFNVVTNCHMRTAGVMLKYPNSMIYLDGA